MVKYEYDVDEEGFRRVDRRGRILPINIVEARRIASLLDLGFGVDTIHKKMVYNQDVSKTTTRSFIKNYREGNISLEGDFPAPTKVMEHMDTEAKLTEMDNRIKSLEDRFAEIRSDCFATGFATCDCGCEDKSWKNLWGRL